MCRWQRESSSGAELSIPKLTRIISLTEIPTVRGAACQPTTQLRSLCVCAEPQLAEISALITSALMQADGFEDLHESGKNFSASEAVVSVILLVVVALMFLYHFFLAWKLLPGGWIGWGLVSGRVPETSPSPVREHRFLQYLGTALLITVYVMLFAIFARNEKPGWNYHHVLLAWVMSLISTFDDPISVAWLGITTGVFLQGVGAYSFRVLIPDYDG